MKQKMTMLFLCLATLLCIAGCGQKTKALNFEGITFTDYKVFEAPTKSLRGMAVSQDGKSLYTGHILLTANGVRKIDTASGAEQWIFHDGSTESYNEYAKGLATDDRGYVYATITYSGVSHITLTVLNDSDGSVVSETTVDLGLVDTGANGIAVYKNGDKYYAYFITNYGANRIYCYDVTDPTAPVINTDFGVDGIVNLPVKTGVAEADANYIAIGPDGSLYVTMKLAQGSKADAIAKFSNDGNTFEKIIDCEEAYGISISGDYLIVSTYQAESSVVKIYNLSDYSLVATVGGDVAEHDHYSQAFLIDNRLYIADQSYKTGTAEEDLGSRILVSGEIPEL
ncbi:MAG TPA: hypothetical protein VJZ01_12915 [Lachnospiraceae bacterium]|nr:hypothetical protein [Lachnospiraceae bacterium]